MPLEIQWFIYAIVANDVLSREEALEIYQQTGDDFGEYAQNVLNLLAERYPDNAEQLAEQLQEVINYASEQAGTGNAPEDFDLNAAQQEEIPGASDMNATREVDLATEINGGIASSSVINFAGMDLDISGVNSLEDLPGLSDIPSLSDEELGKRLVFLLACLRRLGCSDLHLAGGAMPFVRRQLRVVRIDEYVLTAEDSRRINTVLLTPERKKIFAENLDTNFALELGNDRFRVCLMEQRNGVEGSYRLVPDHICSLEELGFLPDDIIFIRRLLDYNNGLVLVAGPIGSGKTTTLASMTDIINEKRQDHIISVEDPIEILQFSRNCQVTQREIGRDTASYRTALKAALREDPDVIIIGEMHDLETIENAITAAETGHLVIGTLHTGDAPNTLNRVLDVFPPAQQPQIRAMTAGSLRGVICQKLIEDGMGGIAIIYEILINTMSVSNQISEGKVFQLKSTMAISNKQGMCTFDQCLLHKYEAGLITYDVAMENMHDAPVKAQLNALWAEREKAKEREAKRRK